MDRDLSYLGIPRTGQSGVELRLPPHSKGWRQLWRSSFGKKKAARESLPRRPKIVCVPTPVELQTIVLLHPYLKAAIAQRSQEVETVNTENCSKSPKIFHDFSVLALGTWKVRWFPDGWRMPHSHIDVRYVANLARLELSDEEVATFQPHLEAVLGHVETLTRLDVSAVDSGKQTEQIFGRMRDDEPHESLPQNALLRNAPDQAQGQVRVPKVVTDV